MKKFEKVILIIVMIFMGCFFTNNVYAKSVTNSGKKVLIWTDHYPVIEGDKQTFYICSNVPYRVQYRVFLSYKGKNQELTKGYTKFYEKNEWYIINNKESFGKGTYTVQVWGKASNSKKTYDFQETYVVNSLGNDSSFVRPVGDINISKNVYEIGEEINIKGIKDVKGKKGPYKYKLHIYDVKNKKWIMDNKDYRDELTWVFEKPGSYLLDLWVKSDNLPKGKQYESWKVKPITVMEPKNNVGIDYLSLDHWTISPGDTGKVYVTSKNADKVQYKAWLNNLQTGELQNLTNGYSNLVGAKETFAMDVSKIFKKGTYQLIIMIRKEGSVKYFDAYYDKIIECSGNGYSTSLSEDINIEKDTYIIGEKISVKGLKNIKKEPSKYMYKLHVRNMDTGQWIMDNGEYKSIIEWKPDKPGNYLLDLWVISTDSKLWSTAKVKSNKRIFDVYKLKPVKVINKKIDEGETIKQYTIVNSFKELFTALEKGYEPVINNPKVKEAYNKAYEVISQIIRKDMNDFEKELAIHNYIVQNTVYDQENYINNTVPEDSYTVYGTLIKGKAVCQGYADTMKVMLNMVGVECNVVTGQTYEEHAWNLVKINGYYYHVDSTLNDPASEDEGNVRYTYFNLSDNEMSLDHTWNSESYPKANKDNYVYLHSMYYPIIDDGWIYYSEELDDNRLYKIKLGGTNKAKLTNAKSTFLATDTDWIYYSNYSNGGRMYKIRKDGIANTMLNEEWSKGIKVQGEWIYYRNGYDDKQYKIKKDGTEIQKVD